MAQTGYTLIQLYSSSTGGATPAAGNLINDSKGSELAINIADGKLFYKDNLGAVKVLASASSVTNVASINFGTTGLTPATATTGAVTVAGTLIAANGGTGQASYAVGDLLYASSTTALSKLADVATGNALISGGVGVAPSYGKIGLTTHVSGTLPTANGGTNLTSFTANGIVYASSTSALTTSSAFQFSGANLTIGLASLPAWIGSRTVTQIGNGSSGGSALAAVSDNTTEIYSNCYLNTSGNIIYSTNGGIGFYQANKNNTGNYAWFTAAAGTAGNTASITQSMTLFASGGLSIGNTTDPGAGVLFVSSGVRFPATQSASSDANTLDDYEEGTWTPVVANAGITSYTATGFYTKIGNVVYLSAKVVVTNKGTASGSLQLTGRPFAPANTGNEYMSSWYDDTTGAVGTTLLINTSFYATGITWANDTWWLNVVYTTAA